MTLTIGIDVGGTKTACVVTDVADRILFHDVVPTDKTALTSQIVGLAQRAIHQVSDDQAANGSSPGAVSAIGVAIPGQVESRRGTAELAVNLGAPGINLGTAVQEGTGLP